MYYLSFITLSLLSYCGIFIIALRSFKRFTSAFLISVVSSFKILIIIFNQIYIILPIKPDSDYYFEQALLLLNSPSFDSAITMLSEYTGKSGIGIASYVTVQSIFMFMFGTYEFVMPMINNLIFSLSIIFLAKTMLDILPELSEKHTRFNLLIIALMVYPAAFSNSIYNLRDTIIIFCFILFMRRLLLERYKAFISFTFYMSVLAIILFRPILIVLIVLILFSYFLIYAEKNIKTFCFSVVSFLVLGIIFQYLFRNFSVQVILAALKESSLKYANGKTYPINYNFHSIYTMILDLPSRFFYFLFYPFPWKVSSYNYVIPVLDAIFQIFLFFQVIYVSLNLMFKKVETVYKVNQEKILSFLILSGISGYLFLALLEFRFGGAIRRRIPFALFLCCSFAYSRRNRVSIFFYNTIKQIKK